MITGAYACGLFVRWKAIAEFALCLSGLVLVWIVCFVPESPRWLLAQDDMEGAERSMIKLRASGSNAKQILAKIDAETQASDRAQTSQQGDADYRRGQAKQHTEIAADDYRRAQAERY